MNRHRSAVSAAGAIVVEVHDRLDVLALAGRLRAPLARDLAADFGGAVGHQAGAVQPPPKSPARRGTLHDEVSAWSTDVNGTQRGVDWQMKVDDARCKLKSVYPNIMK